MDFYWNGILVTGEAPVGTISFDTSYCTPAFCEVWPLDIHRSDKPDIVFTDEEKGFLELISWASLGGQSDEDAVAPVAPDVISDVNLVTTYVKLCLSHNLSVRILLCATTSTRPLMDTGLVSKLLENAIHLGFDYWDGGAISALYLDRGIVPSLDEIASELNTFMLFDEQAQLERYIETRALFLREAEAGQAQINGASVEPWILFDSTYMATDIYEINISDLFRLSPNHYEIEYYANIPKWYPAIDRRR